MRKAASLFLPILLGITVLSLTRHRALAQPQPQPRTPEEARRQFEADEARRRENFKPARDLLRRKGVPFDP